MIVVNGAPLTDVVTKSALMDFNDTVAEWLRRWPAKPLGSARVGSNPTGVDFFVPSVHKRSSFISWEKGPAEI